MQGIGFTIGAKDSGVTKTFSAVGKGMDFLATKTNGLGNWFRKAGDNVAVFSKAVGQNVPIAGKALTFFGSVTGVVLKGVGIGLKGLSLGFTGLKMLGGAAFKVLSMGAQSVWTMMKRTVIVFQVFKEVLGAIKDLGFSAWSILKRVGDLAGVIGKAIIQVPAKIKEIGLDGLNLSTALDKEAAEASKIAKASLANYGYAGKELKKLNGQAVGLSMSLRIGADKAATATRVWAEAQNELRLVGIKSAADMAKLSEVTGLSGDVFRDSLMKTRKEFGFTDAQLKQLVGTTAAYGKASHDIGAALSGLPEVLGLIQKKAALTGGTLKSDELARYAESIQVLSAGMYDITQNADEAKKFGMAIGNSLVESRKGFQDMFAGTSKDLPQFMTSLGIASGDIQVSMNAMKQGPAEFVTQMTKMVLAAKKDGRLTSQQFDFFRSHMDQALGPEASAQLVGFINNAKDSTFQLMKQVQKATPELGKLAKEGFSTGMTLGEVFERSKQMFIQSFRAIGKSASVDFVRETTKAFGTFNKDLKATVAKGGPLADFITKLSEAHALGALAFVPASLRPMFGLLGTAGEAILPAVNGLKAFGIGIGDVLSPMGMLVSGLAVLTVWFTDLTMKGYSVSEAFTEIGTKIANFAGKIPEYIENGIAYVDTFFMGLERNLSKSADKVKWQNIFSKLFKAALRTLYALGGLFKDLATGLWNSIVKGMSPDKQANGIQKLGAYIGTGIRAAVSFAASYLTEVVWPEVKMFASGFFDAFTGQIDPRQSSMAYDLGKSIYSALEVAFGWLFEQGKKLVGGLWKFGAGLINGIFGGTSAALSADAATSIGGKVGEFAKDALLAAASKFAKFARDNPMAAGFLGFAMGGSVAGLAALGIGAGMKISGRVTNDEYAEADIFTTKAARSVGLYDESTQKALTSTFTLKKAMDGAQGSYNWFHTDNTDIERNMYKVRNGIEKEQKFVLASASEQEKAWRTDGLAKTLSYANSIDSIVSAYSTAYHVTNKEALDSVLNLFESGQIVAQVKEMQMHGYLGSILSADKNVTDQIKNNHIGLVDSVKSLTSGMADTIKSTVSGMLGITAGFNPIQMMDTAKDKLKSLASDGMNILNKMAAQKGQTGNKYFANDKSIDEKASLKGNVDTIQKAVRTVAKNLDPQVRITVEQVLTAAFKTAYEKIDLQTVKFAKDQAARFKDMVKDITSELTKMWKQILEQVDIATKAVSIDLATLSSKLGSIASAMDLTKKVKESISASISPSERYDLPRRALDSGSDAKLLLDAVHDPDWYQDYRELFISSQASLQSAISSNATTSNNKSGTTASGNALKDTRINTDLTTKIQKRR